MTKKRSGKKIFSGNIFSGKRKIAKNVTLADGKEPASFDNLLTSEELDQFFENAIKDLNIRENSYLIDGINELSGTVNKAIWNIKVIIVYCSLKTKPST